MGRTRGEARVRNGKRKANGDFSGFIVVDRDKLQYPIYATRGPINTSHVQTVSIDRADTIRFNNQVMDLETLTTQLVQLKQTNPDIAIVIRPDRDLPVQKLIGVMDALQHAGITKVGIATKAEAN